MSALIMLEASPAPRQPSRSYCELAFRCPFRRSGRRRRGRLVPSPAIAANARSRSANRTDGAFEQGGVSLTAPYETAKRLRGQVLNAARIVASSGIARSDAPPVAASRASGKTHRPIPVSRCAPSQLHDAHATVDLQRCPSYGAYGVARYAHANPTSMMSTSRPPARATAAFNSRSKSFSPTPRVS